MSDHSARRISTQLNCFVELNLWIDHIARPDSTQHNSLVESSRFGQCDRGLIVVVNDLAFEFGILHKIL